MTLRTGRPKKVAPAQQRPPGRVWGLPITRLGRWAVSLAAAFVVLYAIDAALLMRVPAVAPWLRSLLTFYGIVMVLCGLAAGVLAVAALLGRRERSWLVWLTLLPAALIILLLLAEVLAQR